MSKLLKPLKMERTNYSDLSSQISQTLDITPKKMKTTNSKSFLYFGRFWYFPRKLKYLTENFHLNCYCSPWSHLTYISIVTSVLWNKESFFLYLFQGLLFKMYSILLKNTVSGSLYWLKLKSQFDLTEHFNLKESLDYHITLAPLWFIN